MGLSVPERMVAAARTSPRNEAAIQSSAQSELSDT